MELKKFMPVYIPDYRVYLGRPYSAYKFRIDLYDKDNDHYQPVYFGDDLERAKEIAAALRTLVRNDMLVSGKKEEPFDIVCIFDNHAGVMLAEY